MRVTVHDNMCLYTGVRRYAIGGNLKMEMHQINEMI